MRNKGGPPEKSHGEQHLPLHSWTFVAANGEGISIPAKRNNDRLHFLGHGDSWLHYACHAHAMRRHTFALILEVSAHIGLWRMNAYKKEHRRVCPEEPET